MANPTFVRMAYKGACLNIPVQALVDLPLDDYGRALISYSGTGRVTWDDGSSNALTFNAAQFSDGRIVVLGHYANDVAFRWFGGGDQSEPTGFTGVTSEGWTLTSEGNARSTNYLPKDDYRRKLHRAPG